jgi:hypothetical protein
MRDATRSPTSKGEAPKLISAGVRDQPSAIDCRRGAGLLRLDARSVAE